MKRIRALGRDVVDLLAVLLRLLVYPLLILVRKVPLPRLIHLILSFARPQRLPNACPAGTAPRKAG